MSWAIGLALLAVGAAWALSRRARAADLPWMRLARKLGFVVERNVSPPRMVRTRAGRRQKISATFRPGRAPETLDVETLLAEKARPPFRFFASVAQAAEWTPILPAKLSVDGYGSALSADPGRAQPLLARMSVSLTRIAAGGTLEVSEEEVRARIPQSASLEDLTRALDRTEQAALCVETAASHGSSSSTYRLRWTGHFYKGEVLDGLQRLTLMLEVPRGGEELVLGAGDGVLARVHAVCERIAALRPDIVARFVEGYAAWVEDAASEPEALEKELVLDTLRLSDESSTSTAYLRHPLFAGHFLEVVLTSEGGLAHVTLQG